MRISYRGRSWLALCGAIGAMAWASAAAAQEGVPASDAASEPAGQLESGEIIVTAQKRAERLQDVPAAVSVVSGESLQARQITNTASLVSAVPSLNFQQGANASSTSLRIRGVGTALFGVGIESSVAVVVDGVPVARPAQGFSDFADLARVEVLRGPQATLFGKSATAGAINIVTEGPSATLSGTASLLLAEQDEYRANASISGPLTDSIRARISGYYTDVGGFIGGLPGRTRLGGQKGWGIRGKLEADVTDRLTLLAAAEYSKKNLDCCAVVIVRSDNANLSRLLQPIVASAKNRRSNQNTVPEDDTKSRSVSLQADYDLGGSVLTSISAYQKFDEAVLSEVDGVNTPVPIFTTSFAQFDDNRNFLVTKQFSQELRIASEGRQRFNYVAGLFYQDVEADRGRNRRLANCSTAIPANQGLTVGSVCPSPTFVSGGYTATQTNRTLAAFGQADFEIVPRLRVLGGLRFQRDKVRLTGTRRGTPNVPGDTPAFTANAGTNRTTDSGISGKAGLQYEFSRNVQTYAYYTKGYKGPGYDTEGVTPFLNQKPVDPETVDAYEIGFKGQTEDRSFSIAVALFQADYSDLQVQLNRFDPAAGVFAASNVNAGKARTRGFEAEATLRPSSNVSIDLAVAHTDTSLTIAAATCPLQDQAAAPTLTGGFPTNRCYRSSSLINGVQTISSPQQDIRGGSLPASPRWRVNVSPSYRLDIADGWELTLRSDLSFQSRQSYSLEQDPLLVQKAYTLVDASIAVGQSDGGLNASLFVKNVFNTSYFSNIGHNFFLTSATLTPNNLYVYLPKDSQRYFGGRISYRF